MMGDGCKITDLAWKGILDGKHVIDPFCKCRMGGQRHKLLAPWPIWEKRLEDQHELEVMNLGFTGVIAFASGGLIWFMIQALSSFLVAYNGFFFKIPYGQQENSQNSTIKPKKQSQGG